MRSRNLFFTLGLVVQLLAHTMNGLALAATSSDSRSDKNACESLIQLATNGYPFSPEFLSQTASMPVRLGDRPYDVIMTSKAILPALADIIVDGLADFVLGVDFNKNTTDLFIEKIRSFSGWAKDKVQLAGARDEVLVVVLERALRIDASFESNGQAFLLGVRMHPWVRQELRLATQELIVELLTRYKTDIALFRIYGQYLDFYYQTTDERPPLKSSLEIRQSEDLFINTLYRLNGQAKQVSESVPAENIIRFGKKW